MHREVDINQYLPEYVQEYREIQTIVKVENPELTALWSASENIVNDAYFNTLTEEGCKQWEQSLKLIVSPTDTLEERRFRIKAKSLDERPYSFRGVERILDNLCGKGNYTLSFEGFTAYVQLGLAISKMYDEVVATLDRIIPLNMILNISLKYNKHITLSPFTHGELSAYTHEQLRTEEFSSGEAFILGTSKIGNATLSE